MANRYRRRSYRHSYSSRRSSFSYGSDRARQHIAQAKALSMRLGGADEDVKRFLFTLPAPRLATFMDAYEGVYGTEKRKYAETVLPKWRAGDVAMSGMVATRLFDLLPRLMQPQERLALTERLWAHFGPSSHTRFRIGLGVTPHDVARAIEQHVMSTVQEHTIPDNIRTQFSWLSGGDSVAKEALLNHVRAFERRLAVEATRQGAAVLLDHMRAQDGQGTLTSTATQTINIGKHRIEILLDRGAQGLKQEDPRVVSAISKSTSRSGSSLGWVVAAAAVIGALLLLGR